MQFLLSVTSGIEKITSSDVVQSRINIGGNMDFKNSIIGIVGTFGSFFTSLNIASDLLRFITLLAGAIIGIHSIYKIFFSKTKKAK